MPTLQSPIQLLTLSAPITVVTLLEDRAQVHRLGTATLTPGLWRIRVEAVAPVLSDKSLRAEFSDPSPFAQINDVRVQRQVLVKESDRPQDLQALVQEWRSLHTALIDLTGDRAHLETIFRQVDQILSKTVEEIPVDAVWGQLDSKSWRDSLQTLFRQLRDYQREILHVYDEQLDLVKKLNDLTARIDALCRPDTLYRAAIEADVMVNQQGNYGITFDYVVPNALWRPWHQARLMQSPETGGQLHFRMDGCVWQRTGEDWTNVDLVFSTARASLGTEPPLLRDDVLEVREKSKQIVVQTRDQIIQTPGLGSGSALGVVQLPGVDDGGEVRNLRALTKATIPADGRPYRVLLATLTAAAAIDYVLMPELATQIVIKSEQLNTAAVPILAGPVDLIRSSEFVGRTSINFVASGESFALGWGADAALRVQRTKEQKEEQNHLTRWTILTRTIKLFLSNIGEESRTIKITERVPVSELEQVKVEVVASKTSDRVQPNQNGFCTWTLTLPAYSQHQLTLVYKLSSAPDVQGIL